MKCALCTGEVETHEDEDGKPQYTVHICDDCMAAIKKVREGIDERD